MFQYPAQALVTDDLAIRRRLTLVGFQWHVADSLVRAHFQIILQILVHQMP